jgi:ArsR family transcriptional regulator, zinc-responsive transcriptional repressor
MRSLNVSPSKSSTKTRKRLSQAGFEQAAECLKILAHPHRLKIVHLLLESQYTVGELAEACEIAHHMTSEHLRLMQRCGFLDSIKDGQRRYYRVVEPQLANIIHCVEQRFGT